VEVEVNGTRLWFDVDGVEFVPDGATMRQRPTVILMHGGPGTYDHSYFKPHFGSLSRIAQVIYLDLRGHGRSAWGDPSDWSFELCADDVRAFCGALGIARPIVFGHSMGGFVAMLYGTRHPGHPGGLILQSTFARFDMERLVEGFRSTAGDEVAELARRDYGGSPVSDVEWARVFAAFGPNVPDEQALARRIRNPAVAERGMDLMREFDVMDRLDLIDRPTLVCVGALDAVTPVPASRELAGALPQQIGRLEVIPEAGHFPWLDVPDRYWPVVEDFVLNAWRS